MSSIDPQPVRSITFRRVTYLGGFLPFQFDSLAVDAVVTRAGLELWSVRQQKPVLMWRATNVADTCRRDTLPLYGAEARSELTSWHMDGLAAARGDGPVAIPAVSLMIADDDHDTVFDVRLGFQNSLQAHRFLWVTHRIWKSWP